MTNSTKHNDRTLIKQSIINAFIITCSIWIVRGIELLNSQSFAHFGLRPRNLKGIVGIFTSPFIHSYSSLEHIWSNTVPLFVLSGLVIYLFNKIALKVLIGTWLITGIWVWFLAKTGSYHIGASGIVYGLLSFLLFSGIWRKNKAGIAISLLLIVSYGTMFWGLFPITEGVSWESHLMGFVAGLILSVYYKDELMYGTVAEEIIPYSPISFSYSAPFDYNIVYVPRPCDVCGNKTPTQTETTHSEMALESPTYEEDSGDNNTVY